MPPITNGDLGSVVNQVNQNIAQQNTDSITKIFKDDAGTRRVLLGKGADGFYGLKVSPEGTDVYSATDDELIFNSSQDVFKIVQTGSFNFSDTASGNNYTNTYTVAHSLGFPPLVFASGNISFNGSSSRLAILPWIQLGSTSAATGVDIVSAMVSSSSFDNQIDFRIDIGANAQTLSGTIKYYILQESAS